MSGKLYRKTWLTPSVSAVGNPSRLNFETKRKGLVGTIEKLGSSKQPGGGITIKYIASRILFRGYPGCC